MTNRHLFTPRLRTVALLALTGFAVMAAAGGLFVSRANAASCSPAFEYGRGKFCGYFKNVYDDGTTGLGGGFVFAGNGVNNVPNSVNSAATLIAFVKKDLQGGGPGGQQDKTGAQFLIETMLGHRGGQVPKGSVTVGSADYNAWVALINSYDAAPGNLIQWHHDYKANSNTVNSFYQKNQDDDAFFTGGLPTDNDTIAFYSPSGKQLYVIRRACGNPIGTVNGLPVLQKPYNLNAALTPGKGTPQFTTGPTNGIVSPGNTYYLTPSVINNSKVDANPLNMEVENLNPNYIKNGGITSSGAYDTGDGYRGGGCTSGAPQCWHWDYSKGLPAKRTSVQGNGAAFTINPATPQGTKVCFRVSISPSTEKAGSRLTVPNPPKAYCFLVYSIVYPSVVGYNSDVHAGGGFCDQSLQTGNGVTGSGSGISNDQYVVSASLGNGINDFGSNGNVGGGTSLNLGVNGGYSEICRPDLLATANSRRTSVDSSTITAAQATLLDLSTLTGHDAYFYDVPGGTLHLTGTINRKITIVVTHGNVEIDGNVTIGGGSYQAHNDPLSGSAAVPSLGIIASGNIGLKASVTKVDAYLFADQDINTCLEANSACATPVLVVNGFFMSKHIILNRLGPSGAKNAVVAEQVSLNPQIYLNPPVFFDNTLSNPALEEGLGEKQPLF